MPLFGKKNRKEEKASCCCKGNCDAASMAKAENARSEGSSVKVLGSGCTKCNQLAEATKLRWNNSAWIQQSTMLLIFQKSQPMV